MCDLCCSGIVQIRVSAVLTNGAYLLNVDCDHYFNNSKALREAMCFMMDPALGKKTCYVQFPQRFDGIDLHDRYANRNIVFFDVWFCDMKHQLTNLYIYIYIIPFFFLCMLETYGLVWIV